MILVTGAAGYIGSHTVHQLVARGEKVLALDNLYSGFRWAIPQGVELIVGNVGDSELTDKIVREHRVESVIHFAAHLEVEESTRDPLKYYRNNTVNTMNFLEVLHRNAVKHFIFSSTCATYGTPEHTQVVETAATRPESPYGRSKLMSEALLWELEQASQLAGNAGGLRHVILRYFNVAGAKVGGGLGQATPRATQLVKAAVEVATQKRPHLKVFGTDYPTPDGTCIRDYIHVDDLADAHLCALDYLRKGGRSDLFNCGYGKGYSVLEVIASMKRVTGIDFPVEYAPRRPGDAVAIFANSRKIRETLGWKPRYEDLDLICRTSFEWEKSGLSRVMQQG
jgi:UDP-glucose 4-epimerase